MLMKAVIKNEESYRKREKETKQNRSVMKDASDLTEKTIFLIFKNHD